MPNLKIVYSIIFISLSGWVAFAYFTTIEIIETQERYAHIINLSGKQRMLSQKTALIAKRYFESRDIFFKKHLEELIALMRRDHNEILIHNLNNSDKLKKIYYGSEINLKNDIEIYFQFLEQFLLTNKQATLNKIETLSFNLLPKINNVVSAFEKESNQKIANLMSRELIILAGTLLTLMLEAIVIVVPAIRASSRNNAELRELVKQRTIELEKLSVTDQLTNLYNRRKFDQVFQSEIGKARRYKNSFSLVLIDVDFFKKVNDTYGHQVGDYVLKTLAEIFTTHVRKSDLLGRWGGEEFVIISLEESPDKTLAFAEKLRNLINNYEFDKVGHLSCSFGIAYYSDQDTVDSLILRADQALYTAKNEGRNCVRIKHVD